MNRRGKGVIAAILALCVAGGAAWVVWHVAGDRSDAEATTQPSRLATQNGQTVVSLTAEEESQSKLRLQALKTVSYKPQYAGYGTLMADPAMAFSLRAPFAGTLRGAEGEKWPTIGDTVQGKVGFVDPRYTPMENVDVTSRLTTAEGDVTTATSALAAARSEYEADVKLNKENKNVSDRAVQDARAAMEQQQAKLEAAKRTVSLLNKTLAATTQPAKSSALAVTGEWQVAEVGAHPGETVDAGEVILRLARWDRVMATVGLPAGEVLDPSAINAKVFAPGQEAHPLRVVHIAQAPAVDPRTMGETLLMELETGGQQVRPGTPVNAVFTPAGKGREGLLVPQDAVVWHDGKAWVYVEIRAHAFERREVATGTPVKDGWFLPAPAGGLSAGEKVVLQGAQQLLSEEFKPVVPAGGDVDDD